jgi:hypothetical protein
MTDEILTELIAAIVAARADGGGVLTSSAVRARLTAAKIHVERLDDASEPPPFDDDERGCNEYLGDVVVNMGWHLLRHGHRVRGQRQARRLARRMKAWFTSEIRRSDPMDQKKELEDLRERVRFLKDLIDTRTIYLKKLPSRVRFFVDGIRNDAGLPTLTWP